MAGPVERLVALLLNSGYEKIEQPQIAGIPFEFAAMLAGRNSLDLVAVVDLAVDADDEQIRRRVEGLARALDLVRSRRSLTVVLVGPRRGPGLVHAIAGVARVLNTGTPSQDDEAALRDALAVLLPLEIAVEDADTTASWASARERIRSKHPDETRAVLEAARSGSSAVNIALGQILSESIDGVFGVEDDEEDE